METFADRGGWDDAFRSFSFLSTHSAEFEDLLQHSIVYVEICSFISQAENSI